MRALRSLFLALGVLLSVSGAAKAVCVLPYTLLNNTLADANQVMANFNALMACINVFPAQIKNTVFAGPTAGVNANPAFRTLVLADLPLIACADLSNDGPLCSATAPLALSLGGTHANLSATGGASQVLKQVSAGADITVGTLACTDLSNDGPFCAAATIACTDLSNDGTACQASTGTSGHTLPYLDTANAWSAAQRGAQGVVTPSGTTFTPDMNLSQHFSITLIDGCPCTIANPTNAASAPGQVGMIEIINTPTGGETVTWGSVFRFAGAAPPVLAVGANAKDYLSYYFVDATNAIVAMGVTNAQ